VPLIPEDYWRIIAARALIQYGDREDAPEIVSGASAEFLDVLDKLESDQLEDQERRRSSTDRLRQGFTAGFPL
jgi:carbonic anhydrase/acetyltransferase-like protein (isoleucine patch superfamily)